MGRSHRDYAMCYSTWALLLLPDPLARGVALGVCVHFIASSGFAKARDAFATKKAFTAAQRHSLSPSAATTPAAGSEAAPPPLPFARLAFLPASCRRPLRVPLVYVQRQSLQVMIGGYGVWPYGAEWVRPRTLRGVLQRYQR